MAGYCNYSMSNNAVDAYESGEMPMSKWTKTAILDRCGEKAAQLSPLTVAELRDLLLIPCGWHHTSKHFNRTSFYAIDEDALNEVSDATVSEIVSTIDYNLQAEEIDANAFGALVMESFFRVRPTFPSLPPDLVQMIDFRKHTILKEEFQ